MIALALPMVLPWVTLALYVAMGGLLVWKLIRTHERPFAWLGLAVVVWPLIVWLINRASVRAYMQPSHRNTIHIFPYTLASNGAVSWGLLFAIIRYSEQLIGAALLLIAVFSLCRLKNQQVSEQEA